MTKYRDNLYSGIYPKFLVSFDNKTELYPVVEPTFNTFEKLFSTIKFNNFPIVEDLSKNLL